MIDIRPIRQEEGEAFLQLLCDVFKLDFNRAYDVFFTEPYFDISRKWAIFEGSEMITVLTLTPLQFGWGKANGLAGVATRESRRNEGFAARLIERIQKEMDKRGEPAIMLFAQKIELYARLGFEPLDRVIRAKVNVSEKAPGPRPFPSSSVRNLYDSWAAEHPDRLIRDEQRWGYWNWQHRSIEAVGEGYVCYEPGLLREVLVGPAMESLPLPEGTEFFGTTLMADTLQLPLGPPVVDLFLMGWKVPGVPQMFMTDQF